MKNQPTIINLKTHIDQRYKKFRQEETEGAPPLNDEEKEWCSTAPMRAVSSYRDRTGLDLFIAHSLVQEVVDKYRTNDREIISVLQNLTKLSNNSAVKKRLIDLVDDLMQVERDNAPPLNDEELCMLRHDRLDYIYVIKKYRERTGQSLSVSKDVVKSSMEEENAWDF